MAKKMSTPKKETKKRVKKNVERGQAHIQSCLLYTSHIGKAGRKRHMGFRPTVRGSVMNPNDHPHGGGEGKAGIGRPGPCTPWGKPALGLKTRKKNKQSNKLIVRRRDGKTIK